MSDLVSIQTKVIVAMEDYELQELIAGSGHLVGLGAESVDHLLTEGDLAEVRTVDGRFLLTFIGVRTNSE